MGRQVQVRASSYLVRQGAALLLGLSLCFVAHIVPDWAVYPARLVIDDLGDFYTEIQPLRLIGNIRVLHSAQNDVEHSASLNGRYRPCGQGIGVDLQCILRALWGYGGHGSKGLLQIAKSDGNICLKLADLHGIRQELKTYSAEANTKGWGSSRVDHIETQFDVLAVGEGIEVQVLNTNPSPLRSKASIEGSPRIGGQIFTCIRLNKGVGSEMLSLSSLLLSLSREFVCIHGLLGQLGELLPIEADQLVSLYSGAFHFHELFVHNAQLSEGGSGVGTYGEKRQYLKYHLPPGSLVWLAIGGSGATLWGWWKLRNQRNEG